MPASFTMKGRSGVLRVGGRTVAEFRSWEFSGGRDNWTLAGTAWEIDKFLIEQYDGSLELRLDTGTSVSRWKNVSAVVNGSNAITVIGKGSPDNL